MDDTPLSVHLPFNRECLEHPFTPAKIGSALPTERRGLWLIVQGQRLVVQRDDGELRPPRGAPPGALESRLGEPLWLGTYDDEPCWAVRLASDIALPPELCTETLVPLQGPALADEVLTLGGIAMQALHWVATSVHCPRCGAETERIAGEWGRRCPRCRYEHFPHLHPAVITLVRDRDRVLLARKAVWTPGRYALIAGFVDNGESLEGAVRREVKEEVGVDVADIRYVGSQNWPFPSQLMIGFVARYAGGEIEIDRSELEDARWFDCRELPPGAPRQSIAGWMIANHARPGGAA